MAKIEVVAETAMSPFLMENVNKHNYTDGIHKTTVLQTQSLIIIELNICFHLLLFVYGYVCTH